MRTINVAVDARSIRSCAIALLLGGAALACDKPGQQITEYPVLVHAVDDTDKPLGGVQLVAAGRAMGTTEATTGDKPFTLSGLEGDRIDFSATCPEGYKGPRAQPLLLLKRVQSLQPTGVQAIELNLVCDAKEHLTLVAVHTGRAGVPVQLRGQPVAVTSQTGTAHVYLREPIGNSFSLTLDTKAQDAVLRPESPSRQFAIGDRDDFTVWDQPFEEVKKPPPPPKVRPHVKKKPPEPEAPPPPPKHIPYELQTGR